MFESHLHMKHLLLSSIIPKLPFLTSSSSTMTIRQYHHHKPSIIVIMGATGTGKTKLSIDLATRLNTEVINCDKIQVYAGLDITTNKVPVHERRGVPHHLLGTINPSSGELTASSYRALASSVIKNLTSRGKVPVIAGGSNSYIYGLVTDRFDGQGYGHLRLRYRCCFVWVDVRKEGLREYLDRRVDEMVGSGMVEELEGYFGDFEGWKGNVGLNKAIGVGEFEGYFGKKGVRFEEAVRFIKENTWRLAEEQVRKIRRLGESGWDLLRVDATDVIEARLSGARVVEEERWERDVVGPALGAVERFLKGAGGQV